MIAPFVLLNSRKIRYLHRISLAPGILPLNGGITYLVHFVLFLSIYFCLDRLVNTARRHPRNEKMSSNWEEFTLYDLMFSCPCLQFAGLFWFTSALCMYSRCIIQTEHSFPSVSSSQIALLSSIYSPYLHLIQPYSDFFLKLFAFYYWIKNNYLHPTL